MTLDNNNTNFKVLNLSARLVEFGLLLYHWDKGLCCNQRESCLLFQSKRILSLFCKVISRKHVLTAFFLYKLFIRIFSNMDNYET